MRFIRSECKNKKELARFDEINNSRYTESRKRLAKAIAKISQVEIYRVEKLLEDNECRTEITVKLANAANLLALAIDDMELHCEWFGYNTMVVDDMCKAQMHLGSMLAALDNPESTEEEIETALEFERVDAMAVLSNAMSALILWNEPVEGKDDEAEEA